LTSGCRMSRRQKVPRCSPARSRRSVAKQRRSRRPR
jgi:hypothetical protein